MREDLLVEVEERIKKVIREQLEIDETVEIDAFDEEFLVAYNLNSVDALEMLLMIEKEFDIEIEDDDLNADLLRTIHSLAEYVIRVLENQG